MGNVVIENRHGRAVVSPDAGASLRSLRVRAGGSEYELLHGGEKELNPAELPHGDGSFIMAPWPNRIRDGRLVAANREYSLPVNSGLHAIHGLVRNRAWNVTASGADHVAMEIDLQPPWPFAGRVKYEAAMDGPALRQTLSVEAATEEFPAGFGWHPWFRRNLGRGEVTLKANAEAMWVLDKDITPTGETIRPPIIDQMRAGASLAAGSVDGCFRIKSSEEATLSWPEVSLQIVSTAAVRHLMVYTPKDGSALCVEPQTATVNAFQLAAKGVKDTGAATAAPGKPLSATTTWSWG